MDINWKLDQIESCEIIEKSTDLKMYINWTMDIKRKMDINCKLEIDWKMEINWKIENWTELKIM